MNSIENQQKCFDGGGYIEGIGRRKTAVARVRVYSGKKISITVNDTSLDKYFNNPHLSKVVREVSHVVDAPYTISVHVKGGGRSSQAEAIRLGFARAVIIHKPELRTQLKYLKLLRRDPRRVERKKYGLKKARRAPQWSKR